MSKNAKRGERDRTLTQIKEVSHRLQNLANEVKNCEDANEIMNLHEIARNLRDKHKSLITSYILLSTQI